MHTASICFRTLKAISAFASTEATRYYLNGVLLTVDANGAEYVATDGHRLAARRIDLPKDAERNTLVGSWIIPLDICKGFKFTKHGVADGTAHDAGNGEIKLVGPDSTARLFKPIDGTFPDWRRVVPAEISGSLEHLAFNGAYLNSVWKLGADLDIGKPFAQYNGEGPSVFTFDDDASVFALLMPLRGNKPTWSRPAWVGQTPVADQLAA